LRYFQRGHDEFAARSVAGAAPARSPCQPQPADLRRPSERNFDVIFLRNVLIYFNDETKARCCRSSATCCAPDGYLLVGHSGEIIRQQDLPLVQEAPSRYRCLPLQPKELP
jgi:chemotaxis protein methyltransferase CheR